MTSNGPVAPVAANWSAWKAGAAVRYGEEYLLYTDARIQPTVDGPRTAQVGPYRFTPTWASLADPGPAFPNLLLRVDHHDTDTFGATASTSTDLVQEPSDLCALASLIFGIRLRSGGPVRSFRGDDPPEGAPSCGFHRAPTLVPPMRGWPAIPRLNDEQWLPMSAFSALELVLSRLSLGSSVAAVRAARSYSRGLWCADDDAELAWLELVAAVETAADSHVRAVDRSAAFREWHGGSVYRMCVEAGGPTHVDQMTDFLGDSIAARYKFRSFLRDFWPQAPSNRPLDAPQWTFDEWWPLLDSVYAHRSARLHAGVPMPWPMLSLTSFENGAPTEVSRAQIPGHGITATTSFLQLHVFEHIVRLAVAGWLVGGAP